MDRSVPIEELVPYMEVLDPRPKSQLSDSEIRTLAESVYDAWASYVKDMMDWQVIGGAGGFTPYMLGGLDESHHTRLQYVQKSREFVRREPHSKQAVRLYTSYGAPMRAEIRAREEGAQTIWDEKFWNLPRNKPVLSPLRRNKHSTRLLSDGELFFTLFTGSNGDVLIRTIDPLEIAEDFVTHPDDSETVIYYKRSIPQKINSEGRTIREAKEVYYLDKDVTPDILTSARRTARRMSGGSPLLPQGSEVARSNGRPVLVYHVPYDLVGYRGNGLLFSVISFITNHRNFLQDRATIVRGLSTYIRTITAKGGSKAVSDLASSIQSSIATGLGYERNPPPAAGSTYHQNEYLTKEETPPITHAGEAMTDARIFRQPIGTGVGITEANLIGDAAIGNLASQVQMEGPQLRNFQDYQRFWGAVWQELFEFVLDVNEYQGSREVDIDFPPIIFEPFGEFLNTMISAVSQGFIPYDEAVRQILVRTGANRVDDLIAQARVEREENVKRAQTIQAAGQGERPGARSENTYRAPQVQGPGGGKRSPRSGVTTREFTEVNESCPLCGGDRVHESQGLRYCEDCERTYNPRFVVSKEARIEEFAESLLKRSNGANGTKT